MYTLKKNNTEEFLLFSNGNVKLCPFQSPLLIPGSIAGTMAIQRETCGSHCPLFQVTPNKESNGPTIFINLKCSNQPLIIEAAMEPEERPHTSALIDIKNDKY